MKKMMKLRKRTFREVLEWALNWNNTYYEIRYVEEPSPNGTIRTIIFKPIVP
jgi:N-acyl-L-homoserine lactone synthetase